MNLLHQVLPKGVCKGLLWLLMAYICVACLNHAREVGSCKSQPKCTTNTFCHFKGLWRVSLIAKDGWSLALLYAPNFLLFSLVPALPAVPLSQPWYFCVRFRARSGFVFFIEFTCSGVWDLHRLSLCTNPVDDLMMWFEWALCGQRCCQHLRETGLSFHVTNMEQAGFEIGLLWRWRFSKVLCTGEASETGQERDRWVQGVLEGSHLCHLGIVSLHEHLCSRGSWASFFTDNTSLFGSWTDSYFVQWELDIIGNSYWWLSFPSKHGNSFNWEIKRSLECFNEIKVLFQSHQFYSVSQSSSWYSSPENPKLINSNVGHSEMFAKKTALFWQTAIIAPGL